MTNIINHVTIFMVVGSIDAMFCVTYSMCIVPLLLRPLIYYKSVFLLFVIFSLELFPIISHFSIFDLDRNLSLREGKWNTSGKKITNPNSECDSFTMVCIRKFSRTEEVLLLVNPFFIDSPFKKKKMYRRVGMWWIFPSLKGLQWWNILIWASSIVKKTYEKICSYFFDWIGSQRKNIV